MKTNTCQQRHRLTLSVLYVMLACLIMLVAVMDATPYVASGFSSLSRGLSQMHSESSVSGSPETFLAFSAAWLLGHYESLLVDRICRYGLASQLRDSLPAGADEAPERHRLFNNPGPGQSAF